MGKWKKLDEFRKQKSMTLPLWQYRRKVGQNGSLASSKHKCAYTSGGVWCSAAVRNGHYAYCYSWESGK